VKDTGISINDKAKKKLFTPFSQGDSSTARCHGGTGLGLTISRNLAEIMGGTLEIVSEISKRHNCHIHGFASMQNGAL
jgi:signal transduction histidine kinase